MTKTVRSTTEDAARRAQLGISRATIRKTDFNHLWQEVKTADVMHSESHTDFEHFEPLGITSYPMDQSEDQADQANKQNQQQGGGNGGSSGTNMNKNQPKGPSAEAMMFYPGGSRDHAVGMISDRRARPYGGNAEPGDSFMYAADNSGCMIYHNKNGTDMVVRDGSSQRKGQDQNSKRRLRIAHVTKDEQKRKIDKKQQQGAGGSPGGADTPSQQQQHKHEGDTNVASEYHDQEIKHFDGSSTTGGYNRSNNVWIHHIPGDRGTSTRADKNHAHIKQGGAHCWMKGGCFHSIPWVLKADDCT